ncbi:rab-GTPase-TBC domain-containing protein [Blastocladiella britannica]|nr:rab-GTPase-TBC domain-containing protein [Blastocladiella britannica]
MSSAIARGRDYTTQADLPPRPRSRASRSRSRSRSRSLSQASRTHRRGSNGRARSPQSCAIGTPLALLPELSVLGHSLQPLPLTPKTATGFGVTATTAIHGAAEDRFESLSLDDSDDKDKEMDDENGENVVAEAVVADKDDYDHHRVPYADAPAPPVEPPLPPQKTPQTPASLARKSSSSDRRLASWLFGPRSPPSPPSPPTSVTPSNTSVPITLTPSAAMRHLSRTRPPTLPPKPASEDSKHLAEYAKMVAHAERAAARAAADAAKRAAKRDARATKSLQYWTTTVLPQWEKLRYTDKLAAQWVRDGIPPRLRGVVWPKALGNLLHVTDDVYRVCGARAAEALTSRRMRASANGSDSSSSTAAATTARPTTSNGTAAEMVLVGREDTLVVIRDDIARTFPSLAMFQPESNGPLAAPLAAVLEAFAVYRADIGYVQGMSYLSAMLLLNMNESSAFTVLCNLFKQPRGVLPAFYSLNLPLVKSYFATFEYLLGLACPDLKQHFNAVGVRPEFFLYEWFLTMFAKPLPLDTAHRVFDLYFLWGDLALFRVAVALLKFFEPRLLGLPFEECLQDVLRLPSRIRQDFDEDKLWSIVEFLHLDRDVYRAACRAHGVDPPE